jgi:hypothetical protein
VLKKLYDPNQDRKNPRRRHKGLGMGVGNFSGGVLKLGKAEIAAIDGSNASMRKKNTRRR